METLLQDIRFAWRQLRKTPAFAAVAVVTLALGIGANTAIFGLLDQALLRSLPVKHPEQLVILKYSGGFNGHTRSRTDEKFYFSYPMYRDLRDRNSVFSGLVATVNAQAGVQWHDQPELVTAEVVSGNYFDVLGIQPELGRLLVQSDDTVPNANPVAVLSFDYWQRRFGADRNLLNQTILVNGHPFTVVGVAQRGFHSAVMGDTPDMFAPMMMKTEVMPGEDALEERKASWLNIIGRLKPGVTREQAEASIGPLWYALRAEELKQRGHSSASFVESFVNKSHLFVLDGAKGFSPLRKDVETPLLIIMGMVGLVALMACANIGSLLLVRAAGRVREMAVRYALGAKRVRVVRQLLVEGIMLGLSGGILGILLAPRFSAVLINMIWGRERTDMPFSSHLDSRILFFNFLLAIVVSLLFSLAPAVQFWRPNLAPALKQQVISAGGPLRFRRIAVGVHVGLSLMLLVAAGLFTRSLDNLKSLNVGFPTDHLVTFRIDPSLAGYQRSQDRDVDSRVLQTLVQTPGVRSVAGTTDPELANRGVSNNITIAGYAAHEDEDMNVEHPRVTPGYFSAMGVPLIVGREFTEGDREGAQKVAVVNESFARHFFGAPDRALGHYFTTGAGDVKPDTEIVGVVRDAKHENLRTEIRRATFTPYLQEKDPGAMGYYIRTVQAPEQAESTIRQAMRTLDSKLVLDDFRTMGEQIEDTLVAERVIAFLAESFALLAALMAAIGLYGVLAYSTAQRTPEIGIRMALGATRASVVRVVLIEVLWLAGIAVAVALPLSLVLASAVRNQLFGISSSDPVSLAASTLLIVLVATVSALLPARRAAKVNPIVALRYE
ncbi:MAG TPA: ABC transporter permease [Candidatus Sulfotelmatobacter sp.]|nr:ABC transporter permease [Candidatus Sulfotelmatobacter sp.]